MTAPVPLATADLPAECAVAIVGSGFGASVAAARIAAATDDVVVLERGREWLPGEFPTDFAAVRSA